MFDNTAVRVCHIQSTIVARQITQLRNKVARPPGSMLWVLPLLLLAATASGQEFRKHNIQFLAGAGIPRGDLNNVLSVSPGVGFSYGYRPVRYLMAEAGYESLFGAARVRDFQESSFGYLRIRDYQQFLPFGGRVILPLREDRIQIYGGGGGVYIRYSERLRQPLQNFGVRFDCPSCALRDGVGYYASVGMNFALDRAQFFRLGFGTKVYRGATEGDSLGAVPAQRTRDEWYKAFVTFGIAF